jgi:hypothetical protein
MQNESHWLFMRTVVDVVGFEVVTEVVMESFTSWDIKTSSPLKLNLRFGGTCPKRRLTFTGLHGVISQKIELFFNFFGFCLIG